MADMRQDKPEARLTDPVSLALVATGGALVLLGDGPVRQFGAAYLALAIARVVLARWFYAADAPEKSGPSTPSTNAAGVSTSSTPSTKTATSRTKSRGTGSRNVDRFAALLGIAAVIALGVTSYLYTTNFPFWDEFISTLKWVTSFDEMNSAERWHALVASHYGHRIVTTRLAALAQWKLTGELNFAYLAALANACLVGAAAIIYAGQNRNTRTPALFAPFLLLLFHPQYHQLTFWGFSIQHFLAFLLEALAFLLLVRGNTRAYIWAIAALLLAAFSFGNGVLVGIIGLAYLCVQRRDREAIAWLTVTTLVSVAYFHNLGIGPARGPAPGLMQQAAYLLEFLGSAVTLGYFTDFIGAMDAETVNHPLLVWLTRATGLLIVGGFAYLTATRHWRRNFTVYGLLALTIGSGALAALHRTNADYASPFMSRYTMHSALCLGLLYLAFVQNWPQRARKFLPVSLAVSAAFCVGSYAVTVPYMRLHRGDMRFSAWMASNAIYSNEQVKIATPFFDLNLLKEADERGVYTIPIDGLVSIYVSRLAPESMQPMATPRIVYEGENALARTWLLHEAESAGQFIPLSVPGNNGGQLIMAQPIEALSVHVRLLRNSGYGDVTHVIVARKSSGGAPLPQ